ncbi:uncharacterized protein [Asterias amurensis]|uniref:uncharacterized protein isoform X1 n=1 Tax=Asterias amurensis TaxID=7602 RepID=UPI003AB3BFAA
METNGGPSAKREDLLIPLQKYKTTLYTHSDEVPEKLQPTDQNYKTALYTNTDNDDLVELTEDRSGQAERERDGLNSVQTMLLIAGYCPGFAATIMMVAIIHTGWVGFLLFAVLTFMLAYAAILLRNCWNLVRATHFEDSNPYGAIAYEAFGNWARHMVNVLVDLVSFGASTVMLLATSQLVLIVIGHSLVGTYCYWPIIIGVIMSPAILVGMPKHFWQLGALSIITTILAILIMFIDASLYLHGNGEALHRLQPSMESWAFGKLIGGTIFLMGGHFVYPEVQRAMKEPGDFDRSALGYFLLIVLFLFPTLLITYMAYGDIMLPFDVTSSLLVILPRDGMVVIPGLLLLIGSGPVLLIVINPLFQHLDELLDVQADFNWKRILSRICVILFLIFIAETVPDFTVLMTLVGGVLFPVLTFMAPAISYLRLRSLYMVDSFSERPKMHLFESIISVTLILATPVIIVYVLISTTLALSNHQTEYIKPCYVQWNTTISWWDNE